MKLTVERAQLRPALNAVSRGISNRNTLAILSHVKLEAEGDTLTLTATDLDTAITARIPVKVVDSGSIALPAKSFADYVEKLPEAPITLEVEASTGKCFIQCGKSKFTILSSPAADFPEILDVSDGADFHVPQGQLKGMLSNTLFAASREESRSLLMGALFEVRGNALRMVATDTHRLALDETHLAEAVVTPITAIVPAKPLAELERLLDTTDSPVRVRIGRSQASFEATTATLISRLLDGQYPNYEKVIPKQPDRSVQFDPKVFESCLQRINIVSSKASNKAIFNFEEKLLTIQAESPESGVVVETMAIQLTGDPLAPAFNVKYILDALSHAPVGQSTNMVFDLGGALSPGLMTAGNWKLVVMPMQA